MALTETELFVYDRHIRQLARHPLYLGQTHQAGRVLGFDRCLSPPGCDGGDDRWEKDGQKHQRLFVKAERMQMLGTRRREASEEAAVTGNDVAFEPVFAETAEDVPF